MVGTCPPIAARTPPTERPLHLDPIVSTYTGPPYPIRTSDQTTRPVAASRRSAVGKLAIFLLVLAVAGLFAWKLGLFALADRAALLSAIRRARTTRLLTPAFVVAYADSLLQGAAGAGRHALLNVALAGALLFVLSFVPTLIQRLARRQGT